jgi:adenylate cyclase
VAEARADPDALPQAFEQTLLGGERKYTRHELSAKAGISVERGEKIWHALGFATVPDDEIAFTDDDVEAARLLVALEDDGFVDQSMELSLARKLGQTQSRLASWQAAMFFTLLGESDLETEDANDTVTLLLPAMERLQNYVWRRHLAAASGRVVASAGEASQGVRVVGFADIVSFTRLSRGLTEAELAELLERFESLAADVVATHGGRVIKSLGDALLYVADEPAQGVTIALALQDRIAEAADLPQLRIGLAYGGVLIRLGDIYGPVVNIAARLTAEARPGRVLADRDLAAALDGNPDFRLRRLKRVSVRGYDRLIPFAVRRSG